MTRPIPTSFAGYVRSLGPGIITVLTWLSSGDIVAAATAGGDYGYALMGAFAVCLVMRALFVSLIAKYQLCNARGETVLAGLSRLHPWIAPAVFLSSLVLVHAIHAFLYAGAAGACRQLLGFGDERWWAAAIAVAAFLIVFRSVYGVIEKVFFLLAGMLTVAFLGLAIMVQPPLGAIAKGLVSFTLPPQSGRFDPLLVVAALVGAVSGGLLNLMYPYVAAEKGWTTPAHRRVQQYDLFFGILVLIVLDLSVWIVGAETIRGSGGNVAGLPSLAAMLTGRFGATGGRLFYIGIFAAIFSSIVGNVKAYGTLALDAWAQTSPARRKESFQRHPLYKWVVLWVLFSPLVWVFLGKVDFVGLTLLVNSTQVLIVPLLVLGMWVLTSRASDIGAMYANRWKEHLLAGFLFAAGCVSALFSAVNLYRAIVER